MLQTLKHVLKYTVGARLLAGCRFQVVGVVVLGGGLVLAGVPARFVHDGMLPAAQAQLFGGDGADKPQDASVLEQPLPPRNEYDVESGRQAPKEIYNLFDGDIDLTIPEPEPEIPAAPEEKLEPSVAADPAAAPAPDVPSAGDVDAPHVPQKAPATPVVEVEQPIDASTSIENSAIEDAATPEVTEIPAPVDVPVDVDASDEDPAPINPPAAVSPLTIEEPSEPAVGVPPEAEPETPADFPVEAQSVDEQPAADVAPVEAPDMIENPGYVPAPAAVPPEDAPSAQPASAQDVPPLDISASDATTDAASDSSSLTPVAQPNDAADIAPVAPPPPLDAPQPEFVRPPIADWALRKDTSQTNTVLQMYTIPFNQNSYRLGSEDLRLITNIAKIHQRTGARIRVVGHSSAIGKQKTQKQALTNFVISMQRAQAIADALVKKGVQAEMIYVEAAADNWPTGAGAKADRRAEIFLDY